MRQIPKPAVVAALLAGGLITLLSASRPWVSAELDSVVGSGEIEASGRAAAPVAAGLALVVLAAAILVAVSGRKVRIFAFVVGLVAGAGIAAAAVAVLDDPAQALLEPARLRTGATNALELLDAVRVTFWPVVAIVGGLVAVSASLAGFLGARRWPEAGRRYEREVAPASRTSDSRATVAGPVDPLDAWQALTGGSDPTEDAIDVPAEEPSPNDAERPGTIMEPEQERVDERAARGEESHGRVAGST